MGIKLHISRSDLSGRSFQWKSLLFKIYCLSDPDVREAVYKAILEDHKPKNVQKPTELNDLDKDFSPNVAPYEPNVCESDSNNNSLTFEVITRTFSNSNSSITSHCSLIDLDCRLLIQISKDNFLSYEDFHAMISLQLGNLGELLLQYKFSYLPECVWDELCHYMAFLQFIAICQF